jgi:hypothetical protein
VVEQSGGNHEGVGGGTLIFVCTCVFICDLEISE